MFVLFRRNMNIDPGDGKLIPLSFSPVFWH
jgi:hypothetical protein